MSMYNLIEYSDSYLRKLMAIVQRYASCKY